MLPQKPGLRLWISWSLATALGAVGGTILAIALGLVVPDDQGMLGFKIATRDRISGALECGLYFLVWVVAGALAGTGQWLILRGLNLNIDWRAWVLVTSVGYLLSAVTIEVGSIMVGITWFLISIMVWILGGSKTWGESAALALAPVGVALLAAIGVASWAVIGVAQSRVLRRYVPSSRQWILANTAAGAIGQIIVLLVAIRLVPGAIFSDTITYDLSDLGSVIMFFLAGPITGIALMRLLRQPPKVVTTMASKA